MRGHTDVPTQNVFDLLLLEATLDDKATGAVNGASGTHFREHVLDDVLRLPMHTSADLGDVGEDGLLALSHDLRGRDREPLACGLQERGVRGV